MDMYLGAGKRSVVGGSNAFTHIIKPKSVTNETKYQAHTLATRQVPGFSQCYSSSSCTGSTIAAVSARDCCVGTDDGLSFSNGGSCTACVGGH